jgi:hypothetical protein
VETDAHSHMATNMEAATATATNAGAKAAIISQGSPRSGRAVAVARATAVAPYGAAVTATTTAPVEDATLLLLL